MTMPHLGVSWDTPLEEPPARGASAASVASYIDDVLFSTDLWELTKAQERRYLRLLCEKEGWSWPQVSRALRKQRIAALPSDGEAGVDVMPSGIAIHLERFPEPQPLCPFMSKYFHLGFCTDRVVEQACESFSELKCGPGKAEELLAQIRRRIIGLEEVHVAYAPWHDGLANMMGQRRYETKMEMFWYRDVNDEVMFVADKPITGRKPPTSSVTMKPLEALKGPILETLWVPGHVDHGWSKGWDFPPEAPPMKGVHVSLDGLSDEQIEVFNDRATTIIASLGIRPGIDPIPVEKWGAVKRILLKIKFDIIG